MRASFVLQTPLQNFLEVMYATMAILAICGAVKKFLFTPLRGFIVIAYQKSLIVLFIP